MNVDASYYKINFTINDQSRRSDALSYCHQMLQDVIDVLDTFTQQLG